MKNGTLFLFLLLLLSVADVQAAQISFRADYQMLKYTTCISHGGCIPFQPGAFSKTFQLDSSQLEVNGVYDVSASLDPTLIFVVPNARNTISYIANAIVEGGMVTDLFINFDQTSINDVNFGNRKILNTGAFDASAGNWSSLRSSVDPFGFFVTTTMTGTYSIHREMPEPATLVLMSFGLLGCWFVRRIS